MSTHTIDQIHNAIRAASHRIYQVWETDLYNYGTDSVTLQTNYPFNGTGRHAAERIAAKLHDRDVPVTVIVEMIADRGIVQVYRCANGKATRINAPLVRKAEHIADRLENEADRFTNRQVEPAALRRMAKSSSFSPYEQDQLDATATALATASAML